MQGVAIRPLTEVGRQVDASLQASVEIACRIVRVMPRFFPLRSAALVMFASARESENHLMIGRSPPKRYRRPAPKRHHRHRFVTSNVKTEIDPTLVKKASNGKYMSDDEHFVRLILYGFYGYKNCCLSLSNYYRNLRCFLILLMS